MKKKNFETIKARFGEFGSFTTWVYEENGKVVKDDLSPINEVDFYQRVSDQYILVGLNPAKHVDIELPNQEPFANFHCPSQYSKDPRLAKAVKGTKLENCYITDLVKGYANSDSAAVVPYVKDHKDKYEEDIEFLKEEISLISNGKNVTLIALGRKTEHYLSEIFKGTNQRVVYLCHYSYLCKLEDYINHVHAVLEKSGIRKH